MDMGASPLGTSQQQNFREIGVMMLGVVCN
jgi:hypothetical protein